MIKQLFFKFSRRLKLDDIIGYAAQISFYMLVSLVPFTTLLVSALGHFKIIRVDTIISLIQETNIFPSSVMSLLKDTFTGDPDAVQLGSFLCAGRFMVCLPGHPFYYEQYPYDFPDP